MYNREANRRSWKETSLVTILLVFYLFPSSLLPFSRSSFFPFFLRLQRRSDSLSPSNDARRFQNDDDDGQQRCSRSCCCSSSVVDQQQEEIASRVSSRRPSQGPAHAQGRRPRRSRREGLHLQVSIEIGWNARRDLDFFLKMKKFEAHNKTTTTTTTDDDDLHHEKYFSQKNSLSQRLRLDLRALRRRGRL